MCLLPQPLLLHPRGLLRSFPFLNHIQKLPFIPLPNTFIYLAPALMTRRTCWALRTAPVGGLYTVTALFIARALFKTVMTELATGICVVHTLFAVFALDWAVDVGFCVGGLVEAVFIAPSESAGDVAWVFVTERGVITF